MAWDGPILTDSGGFQVFSLAEPRKITEEGVQLPLAHRRQHSSCSRPERAIEIQESLGADIIMAFDECPPVQVRAASTCEASLARTTRWAARCKAARARRQDRRSSASCRGA